MTGAGMTTAAFFPAVFRCHHRARCGTGSTLDGVTISAFRADSFRRSPCNLAHPVSKAGTTIHIKTAYTRSRFPPHVITKIQTVLSRLIVTRADNAIMIHVKCSTRGYCPTTQYSKFLHHPHMRRQAKKLPMVLDSK
jgi:hypothetical protein